MGWHGAGYLHQQCGALFRAVVFVVRPGQLLPTAGPPAAVNML